MRLIRIRLRWLPLVLGIFIAVFFLKLVLTVGSSMHRDAIQLSTPEVHAAGDRKDKQAQEPSPPPKSAPPGKEMAALAPEKPSKPGSSASMAETISFLQQRETEIKRKEEQLREKEERLSRMEKEVEQKLKDLVGIQKEIQAYRTEKDESHNVKVRSLAKIYGTMKAKEAAKLMENLDDKLVMNIISTMSSDEAAGILSAMDVKKAAKISEALSGR